MLCILYSSLNSITSSLELDHKFDPHAVLSSGSEEQIIKQLLGSIGAPSAL